MSPLSVVLIPFAGAVLIGLAAKLPRLRDALSWITAIAFFGGIISQIGPVLEGAGRSQTVWTLLPGLEFAFSVEPLGLVFALVAGTLWLVATLYAQSYMKTLRYGNLGRFFGQPADAVRLLRDSDHCHLPAGGPRRQRPGAARRAHLPGLPAGVIHCPAAGRHYLDLGGRRHAGLHAGRGADRPA